MPFVDINDIFIPNTTTKVYVNSSGNRTQYYITPDNGYVIHSKGADVPIYGDDFETIIDYELWYGRGGTSVPINYDFSTVVPDVYVYIDDNGNTLTVPIEKIGAEELYTLPESIVPQNQIYGGGGNVVAKAKTDGDKKE